MKKFSTSTWTTCFVFLMMAIGDAIAIFGNPHGFQLNSITIFLTGITVFGFIDMKFGTFVTLDQEAVTKTQTFFFRRRALIRDIDVIRYQPSYGIGKEVSSLFIFTKRENNASSQ